VEEKRGDSLVNERHLLRVNLGCGTRYHPDWANFDLTPAGPGVRQANFIQGIPLPDGAASCVYHSHILEHLPLELGKAFLTECLRVLAPGGNLRVVVPDLEQSARDYLEVLAARRAGKEMRVEHNWMMVELFDQMVRTRSGGKWLDQIAGDAGNNPFVVDRLGAYGKRLIQQHRANVTRPSFKRRAWNFARSFLPGRTGEVLDEVRFRHAGELHLWMYDELFLQDVLQDVGFTDVRRMTADRSGIEDFAASGLDVEADGTPWKGVSLYMEARRPA
jgi:predicted SAM-dependent methyltransferase